MRTFKPVIRQSKPETRRYSVVPARAIQDDDIHPTTLRLLGAICLHTNKYGICFPSRVTLGRHISRHPKTISVHITRLIKLGYIRKLKKRHFAIPGIKRKSKYATNRYQVLYDGPGTKLPTKEEFYAPRPKIAEEYPDDVVTDKGRDIKGDKRINEIKCVAQAFCSGFENGSGIHKIADNYLNDAEKLVDAGVSAELVMETTSNYVRSQLQNNKQLPAGLMELAKITGLL